MKTYDVRTHGCQMNVHDSERLAGLLETAGYVDLAQPPAGGAPGGGGRRRLQHLRGARERRQQALRQPRPAATGQDRATPTCRSPSAAAWRRRTATPSSSGPPGSTSSSAPTTSARLPALLDRARHNKRAEVEILESLETFPSTLPTRRDSAYAGWVSISVGCNNTCTFCIVPSLRGKEADRRPGEILAEVAGARRAGRRRDHPARPERQHLRRRVRRPARVRQAPARLRRDRGPRARALHQPAPGRVHRRRHRRDGRDAQRHAEPAHAAAVRLRPGAQGDAPLLPQREVPRHHRPRPRADPRRGDHHRHHRRLPRRDRGGLRADARVVRGSRASPAPSPSSTPSAPARPRRRWPTRCPRPWCRSATTGSSQVQEEVSWAENRAVEGREVEVLVATGEGRKDAATRAPVRPRPRQPPRALRRARRRRAPAARRRGHRRGHLRRTAPPRRRRGVGGRAVCRAPHRRGRRVGWRCRTHPCPASPPSRSGCPRWAGLRHSRSPRPPAAAPASPPRRHPSRERGSGSGPATDHSPVASKKVLLGRGRAQARGSVEGPLAEGRHPWRLGREVLSSQGLQAQPPCSP